MALTSDQISDTVVRTTESDDRTDQLRDILERWQVAKAFWSGLHQEALVDDAFVSGKQWPEKIRLQRTQSGRPCLTYNRLSAFCRQIVNKVRQDRPQIKVRPVETDRSQTPDVSNVQGTQDYSLAEVYEGIIRNIEHLSRAEQAQDTALMHCTHHGFGYMVLNTRYSHSDPFVQELVIERVKNSYGCYPDPNAEMLDYSDMQDCFLFSKMTKTAFERKYPNKRVGGFSPGEAGLVDHWYDSDGITVARYYWVDYQDDEVIKMSNGKVHYLSDVEDVLDEMKEQQGIYIPEGDDGKPQRRPVKRPVVKWVKMTAWEFLTPVTETVFERIPVFPVLGDEHFLNGRYVYRSAVYDARDAQRSYNYWKTAAVEAVAMAPKAPYLITPQQIKGHEKMWEQANAYNRPYLLYNPDERSQPPARQFPANPATAEIAQASTDAEDMQYIVGLHDASFGAVSNEKSGRAIHARQAQGAVSTYSFPEALSRALASMGRAMVQAIPRIYDTTRIVRIRREDDSEDFVEINKQEYDEETKKTVLVHDLGYGRYDVVVDTGPSYATQRQEQSESMLELLKVLPPDVLPQIVHLIVKNLAFPGSDEVASVLRRMIPDHLKSEADRAADLPKGVVFNEQGQPVHEDSGEPYQPPLTPELQIQQQTNQIEEAKVQAEMAKAQADVEQAKAKTAAAQADLAEAQRDMAQLQSGGPEAGNGPGPEAMLPEIERIIQQAFKEHELNEQAHRKAFDAAVAPAIVDVLKRVKAYVDGQVKTLTPPTAKDNAA